LNLNEIRKRVINRESFYSLLFPPLLLLSGLYCGATRLRNSLYDLGILKEREFERPIISVGNLVAGGSGKTPTVELIYRLLEREGYSPVIVTRGYKGREKGPLLVREPEPERFGDEASLYALKGYRCVVSKDKVLGVEFAIRNGAGVLIVDDGFQSRKLSYTLNLLLIDPFNPFGDGYCLPLGLLRESLSSLERADAFLITRANLVSKERLSSLSLYLKTFKKPIFFVEQHFSGWVNGLFKKSSPPNKSQPLNLFCGIGNPEQFKKMIEEMGYKVEMCKAFPDHHAYSKGEIEELSRLKNLITTEKDLIKVGRELPSAKAPVLEFKSPKLQEFILESL